MSSVGSSEGLQLLSDGSTKIKGLPSGWRREVVVRKNGQSAGKTDIYYYSPCGKKFRSKPQIARFLGATADLGCFDFSRAGTPGDGSHRRRARDRSTKKPPVEQVKSIPLVRPLTTNPLRPSGPIRRTCGVIKLPVTWFAPPVNDELKSLVSTTVAIPLPISSSNSLTPPLDQNSVPSSLTKANGCEANGGAVDVPPPRTPPQTQPQQLPANSREALSSAMTANKPPLQPAAATSVLTSMNGATEIMVPTLWENRLIGVNPCDYETGLEISVKPQNGLSVISGGTLSTEVGDGINSNSLASTATAGGGGSNTMDLFNVTNNSTPNICTSPKSSQVVGNGTSTILSHTNANQSQQQKLQLQYQQQQAVEQQQQQAVTAMSALTGALQGGKIQISSSSLSNLLRQHVIATNNTTTMTAPTMDSNGTGGVNWSSNRATLPESITSAGNIGAMSVLPVSSGGKLHHNRHEGGNSGASTPNKHTFPVDGRKQHQQFHLSNNDVIKLSLAGGASSTITTSASGVIHHGDHHHHHRQSLAATSRGGGGSAALNGGPGFTNIEREVADSNEAEDVSEVSSRFVSDTEIQQQEERVRLLRQQLMAAAQRSV